MKQNSFHKKKSSAILSLILCTQSAQFRGERLHNTSEERGGISFCAIGFETGLSSVHTKRLRHRNRNVDLFDGQCDGQNGLHTIFACQHNVFDGAVRCEHTLRVRLH